ncbi:MAG: hypothetical protein NZ700_15000 [Gemmataceae bacterium]|nr:hypothetical protein [Gemmataceae bacterium]MDW8266169.1 hypothetical protein [Gemmataceae bacterium]
MTASPAPTLPSGRALAGWWRLLAPRCPTGLWLGHLCYWRIEALACLSQPRPLDPLQGFILRALLLPGDHTLRGLESRVHLAGQLLRRILDALRRQGLAVPDPTESWQPTPLGRQALRDGAYPQHEHQRRTFTFVDSGTESPHFLQLHASHAAPQLAPADRPFDPAWLRRCLAQPAEWKARFGFPLEVHDILTMEAPVGFANGSRAEVDPWQRVMVAERERLLVVVVRGGTDIQGLAVRSDAWQLQAAPPVFSVDAIGAAELAALTVEPSLAQWQQAWREWCQSRHVPLEEIDACRVEATPPSVRVAVPAAVFKRLRSARQEAERGELWLAVETGAWHRLAPVALAELPG